MSENTTTKTLWSETQFELLFLSLKRNRPDREIAEIVMDLNRRGHRPRYLVQKARQKAGEKNADRLMEIVKRIAKGHSAAA